MTRSSAVANIIDSIPKFARILIKYILSTGICLQLFNMASAMSHRKLKYSSSSFHTFKIMPLSRFAHFKPGNICLSSGFMFLTRIGVPPWYIKITNSRLTQWNTMIDRVMDTIKKFKIKSINNVSNATLSISVWGPRRVETVNDTVSQWRSNSVIRFVCLHGFFSIARRRRSEVAINEMAMPTKYCY